jgi:hypothetical protein
MNWGLDFDDSDFAFLESDVFLAAMLAMTVAWYVLGRALPDGTPDRALPFLGAALGALLFAGVLSAAGYAWWPGLPAGAASALVGGAAIARTVEGTRRRLDESAATLLPVWVDLASVLVAVVSALVWPLGLAALAGLGLLALRARRAGRRKHEGLRTLR